MENNNKLIQTIESLYPADSGYSDTAEKGRKMLLEAIYNNWRSLPTEILQDYANACIREDNNY